MSSNFTASNIGRLVWSEIKPALLATFWICLLAFPLMTLSINPTNQTYSFSMARIPYLAGGTFALSIIWRFFLKRRSFQVITKAVHQSEGLPEDLTKGPKPTWLTVVMGSKYRRQGLIVLLALMVVLPFISNPYSVNVLITCLIYVTLGLGLNVVVGVSGLLNLGYIAFYAIGAYTYALLNHYFGLSFWICLPLGGLTATLMGLLLGFPVIRLSGDYLAIVTLSFGEITRLVLNNLNITNGPRGISYIKPPGFFGLDLNGAPKDFLVNYLGVDPGMDVFKVFIYFIILALVILTIVCVFRLENSRLGRAWLAMREDEVACQAMGINRTRAKLTAFALGSTWAGLAGVVFASQITFINPASFSFLGSILILSIVVLGGMGSIPGVILGAIVITALPEQLRFFSQYRMLLFGALMVLMMVFRPEGLIKSTRVVHMHTLKNGNGNKTKLEALTGAPPERASSPPAASQSPGQANSQANGQANGLANGLAKPPQGPTGESS
ncbi:MAG: high-affinity branched-chain amino acid ABC transporter permease LivM [Deltaproteobacteria bacterium]|jgi:branched-chain amino acid transport system permease protein|nr:high-affinity branched-chain amino acid ABC transporter permease LivM [Deltaproteobacteria bacterium]